MNVPISEFKSNSCCDELFSKSEKSNKEKAKVMDATKYGAKTASEDEKAAVSSEFSEANISKNLTLLREALGGDTSDLETQLDDFFDKLSGILGLSLSEDSSTGVENQNEMTNALNKSSDTLEDGVDDQSSAAGESVDESTSAEDAGESPDSEPENELPDLDGLNDDLRNAMVEVSEAHPEGFSNFTESEIANVMEPNPYWENVGKHMKVKDGVKPSDAVKYLFDNPDNFKIECASSVVAISLKAQLDALGADRFDQAYADEGLVLNGWKDAAISGAETLRMAEPGEIINGVQTVPGDAARFDPEQDELIPGDIYYFDKPGDAHTGYQGWNTTYLGENDGVHRFWTMDGIAEVTFKTSEDGALVPEGSDLLEGHYLAASRTDPNGGFFSELLSA